MNLSFSFVAADSSNPSLSCHFSFFAAGVLAARGVLCSESQSSADLESGWAEGAPAWHLTAMEGDSVYPAKCLS